MDVHAEQDAADAGEVRCGVLHFLVFDFGAVRTASRPNARKLEKETRHDARRPSHAAPRRFHYVFNMRDLSRVFQGVLAVPHDSINTGGTRGQEGTYTVSPPSTLVNVWKHECELGVLRCSGAFTLLM